LISFVLTFSEKSIFRGGGPADIALAAYSSPSAHSPAASRHTA
jgi:hypothetical protein